MWNQFVTLLDDFFGAFWLWRELRGGAWQHIRERDLQQGYDWWVKGELHELSEGDELECTIVYSGAGYYLGKLGDLFFSDYKWYRDWQPGNWRYEDITSSIGIWSRW